jgi:hypothetical protein
MPSQTAPIKTISCRVYQIAVDNAYQTWFTAPKLIMDAP